MGKSSSEPNHHHPAIVFVGTVDSASTVAATLADKKPVVPDPAGNQPANSSSGNTTSLSASSSTSVPSEPSGGVQYVYELPLADEERLERLFKKLDRDANGRIDIHDLSEALREVGMCHTYAKVCFVT